MDKEELEELKHIRILLVDDEPFMRRVIEQALSKYSLKNVIKAADGREALDILANEDVDLLLTDVQMPEMNGLQLLKTVRCGYRQVRSTLPTVIVTGLTDIEIMGHAIGLDVSGFLTKPVVPASIVKTVMKAHLERDLEPRDKSAYLTIPTSLDHTDQELEAELTDSGPAEKVETVEQVETAEDDAVRETRVYAHQLEPYMQLTRDVVSETGRLLLSAGFVLNTRTINRLMDLREVVQSDVFYVQKTCQADEVKTADQRTLTGVQRD